VSKIKIISVQEEELTVVHQLAEKIWPEVYDYMISQAQIRYMLDAMYSLKSLRTQLKNGHEFLLLLHDDTPMGFCSFQQLDAERFRLQKLYVSKNGHGKGWGYLLLHTIEQKIKSRNGKVLELNVNRNNRSLAFYQRQGFQIVRSEDIDIGNGFFMNDFVMEKKLTLE